MVLQDLRTIDLGDSVRFSVRVSYENITLKDFELYYEVDKKYSQYLANSYEAFVSAVIIPTMGVPEDIYVKGGIDQKFLENMDKVMRLIVPWKVSDSWHKKINKIKIHPDHIIQSTQARTEKSAMFFSSGVDSFYTLLKLQEDKTPVDYLISVIGFDIGLENSKLINEFDKSLKEVARQTKAQPIIVRTNYREFLDQFPPDSANLWEMCHGAGLASVALTLQSLWGKVYINSDDAHLYRIPYGTHPTLDTLWSSSLTEFICFGAKLNRLEKIRFIEHDPLTHNYLRVCWENKGNKYNCSACEKCLRTILQLKLDGVLKDFNVFEQNLNIDLQSFDSFHLPQMCRVYIWEYYYSNLKGKEDTLRQAIRHYLIKSYKRIIEKNKPYYKIKFGLKLLMLKLNLS